MDHIPISFRLWKAYNPSEERDAVPEREKEWCWRELKKNFTVPAESEEICKRWTLSKMAEQLQSFKKVLTKKYIKTGTTPVFTGKSSIQKSNSTMMDYLILTIAVNMIIYVYICN